MISFDDTDYGETDIMKGLLAGVAGGLLASFLMEQFRPPGARRARHAVSRKHADESRTRRRSKWQMSSRRKSPPQAAQGIQVDGGEAVHYGMGASSAAIYVSWRK